jgi:hypothetical protein
VIDWRELFHAGEGYRGEMSRFHIVFTIRVNENGILAFYCDDGCIIRRNGVVVHSDRLAHHLVRSELAVQVGDRLEIAHWQYFGNWMWGARIETDDCPVEQRILAWIPEVEARLARPNGPALKMFSHGASPLCTVVALYSMILNGYRPSGVYLYGDYQWSEPSRRIFASLLPFATITTRNEVTEIARRLGGEHLVQMADQYWWVMKCCVALLCDPGEFCLMDDDIFVLNPVDDALEMLRTRDFVFAPDANYADNYKRTWGGVFGHYAIESTESLNTGLYWIRRLHEPAHIAKLLVGGAATMADACTWEQGFFAYLYADRAVHRLSPQSYFYPLFDGLPGGICGYDYALNPCGFSTVHFGGPVRKPADAMIGQITDQILGRAADIFE